MNTLIYDIGGTFTKWAIVDKELNIHERGEFVTFEEDTPDKIDVLYKNIADHANELKQTNEFIGIGISTACVVDFATGEVLGGNPTFPNYAGFKINDYLFEHTGLKTLSINDGNSGVIGEYKKGALQGKENGVMIVIGTGIGAGILYEGKVFNGHRNWAGEIGFQYVDNSYWEDIASTRGLCNSTSKALGVEVDGKYIFDNMDNQIIKGRYQEWIKLLAIGIKNTFHVLGIGNFIIGGGISSSDKFDTNDILQEISKIIEPDAFKEISIVKATLGNDANILGIASLVLEKYN